MLNSPMLSIFQHFHAIPLRSPLSPSGSSPRWGAKNVLPLNLIALPRGEGFIRRYSFSTYACIRSDVMGKAVFSYRSLPHWGRGTASAVDRVLSYNACLRRIFHLFQLSFMPLEPYPARYARHLPLEGKAGDTRETCHPQTFGHRPIYICGEAATT